MGRGSDNSGKEFEAPVRVALDGYEGVEDPEVLEAPAVADPAMAEVAAGTLGEQLRSLSKTAQETRQEQERREKEERQQKMQARAREIATRKIAELPEKMKEEAEAGRRSYCVFQWITPKDDEVQVKAWEEIKRYAESQGLTTSVHKMEPFGSDPMFPYTVWSYYVNW